MENGDLLFNFEHLGLVRLDKEGKVVWKLPYQTHHSIHQHDDGNFWVCGQIEHSGPDPRFPERIPRFEEYTILEITPGGEIANEWSVPDLLMKNNLKGLLYMASTENKIERIKGDILHLNDVEPFPENMEEGFFKRGDVLVSLRNINTVFAFNRETEKIKYVCCGKFLRQHDPDFIDGNTFSVFDNNQEPDEKNPQSRILVISALEGTQSIFFEGSDDQPFYTYILGKHQWLPNGNLLVTESCSGKAFELNPKGEIVWEYINYVDEGIAGIVEEVTRLPGEYAKIFRNE